MQTFELKYHSEHNNTLLYLRHLKQLNLSNINVLAGKGKSTRNTLDYLFAVPIKQTTFSEVPTNSESIEINSQITSLPCFAVGYLNYTESAELKNLTKLPHCTINLYNWQITVDSINKKVFFNVFNPSPETETLYKQLLNINISSNQQTSNCQITEPFTPIIEKDIYKVQFDKIQAHIQSGDVYQINLTQPFQAKVSGQPLDIFCQIFESVEAPYCAYMENGEQTICSFSPEEFITINSKEIKTSPIKGTIPRGNTHEQDQTNARKLKESTKDRAEHIMIVDLLRNDLGKICDSGSIKVDKLLSLESFSNVHHLVSTISGDLKAGITPLEALISCFPGGSITGAPKIKAMEIIHQLEEYNRQVYCGSIFYIEPNGKLLSNIPIRTIVAEGDTLTCWSGGGIVADSKCESEYQEAIDKINHLFKALQ